MNYKKTIGSGLLLWVIMFAVVSAVLGFYNRYFEVKIIIAVTAGIVTYLLAGYVELRRYRNAFEYGIIVLLVGVILDLFITRQFNPDIFSLWSLWLGYAFILLAPFARVRRRNPTPPFMGGANGGQ